MKSGHGHAIFTAECSHAFHFHCITANVKHGNQICPVCRAKWKEIPVQNASSDISRERTRINHGSWPQEHAWVNVQPPLRQRVDANRHVSSLFHAHEPAVFDDDEPVYNPHEVSEQSSSSSNSASDNSIGKLKVETYPEISAVSKSVPHDDFAILIHLKAPVTSGRQNFGPNSDNLMLKSSRTPVDLVTVLDVSGSMAGTKLALLKRAMGFVIQNLGPSDRLAVIAFSSAARRVFPLRRMYDSGKQEALQAVNSLIANGGTNIAEGLKKGAKVMTDRKYKNPVSSIILLSDGQDTYTLTGPRMSWSTIDYSLLLHSLMHLNGVSGVHIPVHTFGFGTDHDATTMHSISETSGGTFSFIEEESVIQDAFAQCIGGLLSVVVQQLQVTVECVHPKLRIDSIKAGSFKASLMSDARSGFIDVGDLYAEEERNFLVTMDIPVDGSINDISLVKVGCTHKNPITKEMVILEGASEVIIRRPEIAENLVVSMEVDRQRNRLKAAEAIAEARAAAERGDLPAAVSILERCCKELTESVGFQSRDRLCIGLVAELKEMQERMASRRVYEASGRAYVLSGLSSHSWQRATARGDSTDMTSMIQTYQTPSMVDMVNLSQTMCFGNPSPSQPSLRAVKSFPARPRRR